MSARRVRFLAVGDLMVDVVVSGRGHEARSAVTPGGSAANAAVWAASLGAEASVVGAVGDDPAGRFLREELARWGVEARFAVAGEGTGTFVLADGEVRVDRGANASLSPSRLPVLEADAVLVSGYLPSATVAAAVERSRSPLIGLDAAGVDELPEGPNVILLNENRARSLTGEKPEEAALRLGERYETVCVTCGADGALAVREGHVERVGASDPSPQDVAGAGDAFAAGFLVTLARGGSLAEALAAGAACGEVVARSGAAWPPGNRVSP